jgi:hypothetical protein
MQTILEKTYHDENLLDAEEDITDAINEANLPKDEYNFIKGSFKLTLTWTPDA